ncbi:MAG: response regulator [Chloroflexi bacterium]|nr:response regulator [Chloroflexota bacterium]MBU1750268.1 response regulator [Chloroflexota bacterium]
MSAILMLLAMACDALIAPTLSPAASPPLTMTAPGEPDPTSPPSYPLVPGDDIRFECILPDEGLSQSVVQAIVQDRKGFLWFGTQDGLNRYDGYEFVVYKHDPEDPGSLSNNHVWALVEDDQGRLWIGTAGGGLDMWDWQTGQFIHHRHVPTDTHSLSDDTVLSVYLDREGVLWVGTQAGGLNRLDPATGQFTHYRHDPADPTSLSDDNVQSIYQDREGVLWVGTQAGGLNRLNPASGQFTPYRHNPADLTSLSEDNVQSIHEDREGVLWIGTNTGGLNRFDRATGRFIRYQHTAIDPHSLSYDNVFDIYEDREGVLWIATMGGGLNRLDRATGRFIHYRNDPNDPHSLSGDMVQTLYQDRGGILWSGMFGMGLCKYDRQKEKFAHYRNNPADPHSLSNNGVWSIYEDRDGTYWIGTANGLNRFDRATGRFTRYQNDPTDPYSLGENNVLSVCQDREGMLWVGTVGGGLNRLDPATGRFTRYRNDPRDPHSLSNDNIMVVYVDRAGVLWAGSSMGGLNRLDPDTGRFTRYMHDPTDPYSLSNDAIASVYQDREGVFWIGTFSDGLNRFEPDTGHFTSHRNDPADPNSLSNNTVLTVHEDKEGILWIGTFGGGLNRFDRATGIFTQYREKDGLPNDSIYGILEDDQGFFWISTNKGLSRFDPRTETFKNYDAGDGLQSDEFNQNAYYKSNSGELFFGGINGFNAFYPQDVRDSSYIPSIVVTDFRLFNESVKVGGDSPLNKPVAETRVIELSYEQDFFSFEFAALDYSAPAKNQYAYMMDGLDKDWNYVDSTRRFAGYTSVPPGDYTFRVKGTNSDGVWNEEGTAIRITITPPFWETWWFRILAAGLVIGGVLGFFAWRIRSIEGQRRRLEIQVQERTSELRETLAELNRSKEAAEQAQHAAETANRAKSVFLANMSHELRTPMNAVLGFTQLMTRDTNLTPAQRANLGIINRSGEHLLGLINDVLEMSKIEAGRAVLSEQSFDLHRLLDGLEEMFLLRAERKGLALTFERDPAVPQYVQTDEGKLRQVLMNLIGNAIKFTPKGGVKLRIASRAVHTREVPSAVPLHPASEALVCQLQFEVQDTGLGIASEDIGRIFDPFVQTASEQQSQEGTGLGLSISRQFVRLMGGDITVTSAPGQGSTFAFAVLAKIVDESAVPTARPTRRVIGLERGQPTYRLLIVDDKEENRQLLVSLLAPLGFQVREAINGREAIEIWDEWEPHLICMDMRMPVMDGYEATRRIKATTKGQATVIMAVTASALEEDRDIILSEGCDAYIRKPFQEAELFDALTKHLGVCFVYGEPELQDPPPDARAHLASKEADTELIAGLRALPAHLLADLRQATVKADWNHIQSLIDEIREPAPALADALTDLARQFEYRKILTLIQQAGGQE